MGGGPLRLLRLLASWLSVLLTLSVMAGCSLMGMRLPAPIVELPASAVEPPLSTVEEPSDTEMEDEAEAVEGASSAEGIQETPESGRHIVRRKHRKVRKPHPPPPPPQPVAQPPAPPPAPAPKPAPLVTTRAMKHEQVQGLLDSEVRKPDGKVIGRAVDMVIGADGKPVQIVVNLTGFMGVGDRKANFPWTRFRFNPTLKKAPIMLDVSPGEVAPPPDQGKAKAAEPATAGEKAGGAHEALNLPLSDATVENKGGGKVGRVVDMLVDGKAQLQALVLDVSNSIGHDQRNIAADWSAMHLVTKDKALHLEMNMTDAQIKAAPAYAMDRPLLIVAPIVAPPAVAASTPVAASAHAAASTPVAASAHTVAPPPVAASAHAAASTPAATPVSAPASSPHSSK